MENQTREKRKRNAQDDGKIENEIDSKKASLFSNLFTLMKDNTDIKSSIYEFNWAAINWDWKTNYLNYLETEHIIGMMLALHPDRQGQMRSDVDVTSTDERETITAISQKNSVKAKDIQKELHKLRVLYKLNERRNNELMLWRKMKSLTEMIEKLTRQRVAASTVNQRMKN